MTSNASPVASFRHNRSRSRLNSIDFVRGFVLVIMVLDHTRDFFNASPQDPSATLDPFIFFTRWITHICAPVFMLLTGTAAALYASKVSSTKQVSYFLLSRGLWLIFAELLIVRFAWMFSLNLDYFFLQVIFAIGGSMLALAMMVFMPRWLIASISLVMIFGHNAVDNVHASALGHYGFLWNLLHESGLLQFGSKLEILVLYPLVPWIGVVSIGYVMGSLYQMPQDSRIRYLKIMGVILTVSFLILRWTNFYGNPVPWQMKGDTLGTIISFLNVEKYPPSLLFLLMTLGPACLLLAFAEKAQGIVVDFFTVFGRVPFFFYVTHLFLLHTLAVLYAYYTGIGMNWLFGPITSAKPENYGIAIGSVYLIWPLVIIALYPPCKWFADLKQRRKDWWLSYI
ncbi:hypothetical protein A8O14_06400 [Polynucleobacter wuianus]|uniref:Heparan-alpha-glucosaminide N-acetyltransferase catalytic domain-containing protein n=2 Tax=Burkholderiaceae TaxID=119060 RepID=A0A191UIM6_9BURK|nr:hypothetical protein A8O14_06400 [Polynucleobacter wuianus]